MMNKLEILKKIYLERECNYKTNDYDCDVNCDFYTKDAFYDCILCRDADKRNVYIFDYIKEILKFEYLKRYL